MNDNGDPVGGFTGFLSSLRKLADKFNPQKIVIVFDGPDAGRKRRSLLSTYKDKRGRKSRLACVDFGDGDKEYVDNENWQLQKLYNFLKQLPIDIYIIPYYEADDIIAHLVQKNQDCINIISSTDKDYLQLVNENTFVWSPQKKILFTPDTFFEYYKLPVNNFIYLRSMVGDSSDKLSGLKGIGEKTLKEHLPVLFETPFNNFEDFWSNIETIDESTNKGKTIPKLKSNKDQVWLMYRLMQLTSSDINLRAIETLNQQIEQQGEKGFSKLGLKLYCIKERLESYIKDYEIWIRPFVFLKPNITLNA